MPPPAAPEPPAKRPEPPAAPEAHPRPKAHAGAKRHPAMLKDALQLLFVPFDLDAVAIFGLDHFELTDHFVFHFWSPFQFPVASSRFPEGWVLALGLHQTVLSFPADESLSGSSSAVCGLSLSPFSPSAIRLRTRIASRSLGRRMAFSRESSCPPSSVSL